MKILMLLLVSNVIATAACSRDRQAPKLTAAIELDNSGRTVDDRNEGRKTAEDQSENETDRAITRKLRDALIAEETLSINAKNVKIITEDGMVTLRGPVKNEQEKNAVEAKAKRVPGVRKVDNQLEISTAYGKSRFA